MAQFIKPKSLSVVVPVRNEEDNVAELIFEIRKSLKNKIKYEIIYVDDGSTDDTFSVLQLLKKNKNVEVLRLQSNLGKAEALRMGFLNALNRDFDFVGLIDSDESFNIHEVVELCNTF